MGLFLMAAVPRESPQALPRRPQCPLFAVVQKLRITTEPEVGAGEPWVSAETVSESEVGQTTDQHVAGSLSRWQVSPGALKLEQDVKRFRVLCIPICGHGAVGGVGAAQRQQEDAKRKEPAHSQGRMHQGLGCWYSGLMTSSATPANLAQNLRRLREVRGWTQQQLAQKSGVPRPTVAHLESGDGNPTLSIAVRIAGALGVALETLVQGQTCQLRRVSPKDMPTVRRGQGICRRVVRDGRGLEIERIELAGAGKYTMVQGHDPQWIVCEQGRVLVRTPQEAVEARSGEVLWVPGETTVVCENQGARRVILYVVVGAGLPGG